MTLDVLLESAQPGQKKVKNHDIKSRVTGQGFQHYRIKITSMQKANQAHHPT